MTVLKTSMRNFFAHKGRMALSAIAVLLSVAFVCGTLVFTDTMNTTFDKLFARHRLRRDGQRRRAPRTTARRPPQTGKPRVAAGLRARQGRARCRACKSAEGGVTSMSVTVVDARQQEHGAVQRRPDHRRQLDRPNDRRRWRSPPATPRSGSDQAMVDADTADKHHLKLGDALRGSSRSGDFTARRSPASPPSRSPTPARPSSTSTPPPPRQTLVGDRTVTPSFDVTAAAGRQRRPAQAERRGGARRRRTRSQTAEGEGRREPQGRRQLPGRHEVRDARLRRDRLPRRHLPDRQHLLDAGRPAHPRDRPDAGHRLQPQAGQPVGAGRGGAARRRRLGPRRRRRASASPSA